MGVILLLLCIFLGFLPCGVQAASTADAVAQIDPSQSCSLTLSYGYDGTAFADVAVALYQIAEVSADFQYRLTSPFASTGLHLNGVTSNSEWNVMRETFESHILANTLPADRTAATDTHGAVFFDGLQPGLYLAIAADVTRENGHYCFTPALVALPGLGADGLWQYQVAATAKSEMLPPVTPDEEAEFKVLKLWQEETEHAARPQSIQVEIFRDGTLYETVTLSRENNWTYTWRTKSDGASWHVAESNVPEGYTATVESRDNTFVVTNRQISQETPPAEDPNPTDPPRTGDTANILLYAVLMFFSGSLLILLAFAGKRKRQ